MNFNQRYEMSKNDVLKLQSIIEVDLELPKLSNYFQLDDHVFCRIFRARMRSCLIEIFGRSAR